MSFTLDDMGTTGHRWMTRDQAIAWLKPRAWDFLLQVRTVLLSIGMGKGKFPRLVELSFATFCLALKDCDASQGVSFDFTHLPWWFVRFEDRKRFEAGERLRVKLEATLKESAEASGPGE